MAQVVVELTGDEAKLLRSMQRVIEQNVKTKDSFAKTGAVGKEAGATIEKGFKVPLEKVDKMMVGVVTRLGAIASATNVATAGINSMKDAQSAFLTIANKSAAAMEKIASAQNQLSQNLAGQTATEIDEATRQQVPRIMKAANFSDGEKVTEVLGATGSIVGKEQAVAVTALAAQFTRHQKDLFQPLATSIADLMKATGISSDEAAALLFSEASIARPENISKLAQGSVVAVQAAIGSSPKQDVRKSALEAGATFSVLSKVDPQGDSTGTASVDTFKLMKQIFSPDVATKEERTLRIEELQQKKQITSEEQTAIDRAMLSLQVAQQKAAKVPATDQSQPAQSIRLELREAEAKLAKAKQSAVLTPSEDSELRQLSATVEVKDPGDFLGRLEAIHQNPALKIFAEDRLTGEAKFQDIQRGFLDANSKHFAELKAALSTVNLKPETTRLAIENQSVTPQQKLADIAESGRVTSSLRTFENRSGVESVASMVDAEVKAGLEENRLGFWRETQIAMGRYAASWFFSDPDSISSVTPNSTQAVDIGTSALRIRRSEIIDDKPPSEWTVQTKEAVESLDRRIATLQAMRPLAVESENVARSPAIAAPQNPEDRELMKEQNKILGDVKRVLEDAVGSKQIPMTSNPALINAQLQAGGR